MTTHRAEDTFPRGPLVAAGSLIVFVLLFVAAARVWGIGVMTVEGTPTASREFRFADRTDGGISVYEDRLDRPLDIVPPGTNGFLRATLRGLARERKREGIGPEAPFRLTSWEGGRLTLEDPSTQRHIDLEAFGPTNYGAFARLMALPGNAP